MPRYKVEIQFEPFVDYYEADTKEEAIEQANEECFSSGYLIDCAVSKAEEVPDA